MTAAGSARRGLALFDFALISRLAQSMKVLLFKRRVSMIVMYAAG